MRKKYFVLVYFYNCGIWIEYSTHIKYEFLAILFILESEIICSVLYDPSHTISDECRLKDEEIIICTLRVMLLVWINQGGWVLACSTYGRDQNFIQTSSTEVWRIKLPRETELMKLKIKLHMKIQTGFSGSGHGPVTGFCEGVNEYLVSIKGENYATSWAITSFSRKSLLHGVSYIAYYTTDVTLYLLLYLQ